MKTYQAPTVGALLEVLQLALNNGDITVDSTWHGWDDESIVFDGPKTAIAIEPTHPE